MIYPAPLLWARVNERVKMEPMPEQCARNLRYLAYGNPLEVCGFVMDDWTFVPIKNVAERPEKSFFMDPVGSFEFLRENHESVIGIFHSHPGGTEEPSGDDVSGWPPEHLGLRYWVVTSDGVGEWVKGEDGTEEVHRWVLP